ncbi:MAG: hypothetical protein IJ295_02260, partial [Clostridia bacterium]|nr:hypothetical protein [Clostridia bacterium]
MKKICKILTVVLVMALLVFTPGMPAVANQLMALVPAATTTYTAPTQNKDPFYFDSVTYDLSSWTKPNSSYITSQQVTTENNAAFNESNANTLTNDDIRGRSPYAVITNTPNMPDRGYYTTNAINLSVNSYYLVSVDYHLVEQKDNTTGSPAFGTFYINNVNNAEIQLGTTGSWETATFYIATDKLEAASITPQLYFGSRNQDALGGIYFDKFTVSAVTQDEFETELASSNASNSEFIDFTQSNDVVLVKEFANTDFEASTASTNAEAYNNISTASIPTNLGFASEQSDFYNKDGSSAANVMLLKGIKSTPSLTLAKADYTFTTNPHEVYMFQFYSIATSATDFTGFNLMIGDTTQQITNLTSYSHYNGWQLNTVFYIAGQEINQEHEIKFTFNSDKTTTGWACIDEFKIYKVNGSYAADNATALGVHGTCDQYANTEDSTITNGAFDLGRAADTVNISGSGYPYPLVDETWTSNVSTNGIVNWHSALWNERFGDNQNSDVNNHVYMMRNNSNAINTITSPALTTTVNATTYISFDACSTNNAQTQAYIFTAETDDNGEFINPIRLGDAIEINDTNWQRYEFAIVEDEFASSRNYYLRFEMNGSECYTYIDNVSTSQTAGTSQTATSNIDLTNVLSIEGIWQAADEITEFYHDAAVNGLTLKNVNQEKTVIQNSFAYNFTATEYYEIIVQARGKNAYLGLSGYDGLLEVITDEADEDLTYEYKLYLQPTDTATTTTLQITLGYVADTDDTETTERVDGQIFINNITVKSITEDEYNLIKEAT